ncbi:uncharacterized protein [Primulina huaijiensis]|uniref:uncharacterized protein n=1 Tax=Primulina huaijiensis TaxID=1492673 RepID=UPI003CC781E3
MMNPYVDYQIHDPLAIVENVIHPVVVAMDCEMVGCGSDGSLDLCLTVCLVDEDAKLIFDTYVVPQIPITNYRDTAMYRLHDESCEPFAQATRQDVSWV